MYIYFFRAEPEAEQDLQEDAHDLLMNMVQSRSSSKLMTRTRSGGSIIIVSKKTGQRTSLVVADDKQLQHHYGSVYECQDPSSTHSFKPELSFDPLASTCSDEWKTHST